MYVPSRGGALLELGGHPPQRTGRSAHPCQETSVDAGERMLAPAVCQKAEGPGTGLAHTKECVAEKIFQAAQAFAVRSGPDQSDATRTPAAVQPGHGAPKTEA